MNVDSETSLDTLKNMQVMIKNFLRIEDGSLMKTVDMRQYGYDTGWWWSGCVDADGGGGGDDSVCCVVKVMMMIMMYALAIIVDNDIGDLVSNVTVQELCVVHPQLTT